MRTHFRRKFPIGLMFVTALISLAPTSVFAVSGTVYFTPGNGTAINGTEFTVDVRGDVPGPTTWPFYGGGAMITVSYDASKLELISRDDSGGVFQTGDKNWDGSTEGTIHYQSTVRFNASGVNDQKIISIKFKAIATGTTTLNFTKGTNVNDGPTKGTPSTFTIVAPTCPAGQVGTPPNCTTPPPPPPPSPPPVLRPTPTTMPTPPRTTPVPEQTVEETPEPVMSSEGGLKIEDVKVVANRSENIISWSISHDTATPTLLFGTNKDSLEDIGEIAPLEDGRYEYSFKDLRMGTLYYFTIKASTNDNLLGATYSGILTTRGYPVQLTVKQNGLLMPGAKVKIGERQFVANKDATVSTELADGKFTATVTPTGSTESSSASFIVEKLPVPSSGNPTLQRLTLNIATASVSTDSESSLLPIILGGAASLVAAIGALIGFFFIKRRREDPEQQSVDIDTGQLQQAYGSGVEQLLINTPEPNLESPTILQQNTQDPYLQPPQIPVDETQTYPPSDPSINPSQVTTVAQGDPALDTHVVEYGTTQPALDQIDHYNNPATTMELATENTDTLLEAPKEAAGEVLSQDMMKVESSEEPASDDRPSAIYDEETGQLSIIHHKDQNTATDQVTPDSTPTTPSITQQVAG